MTRELRRSGVFSLNVRPMTSTRDPWTAIPRLVDEGDVDIALGVLDDLGRLGHLDRRGGMRSGNGQTIELVHEGSSLRGRARGDLDDVGDSPLLVARVDPLGAVSDEEVLIEPQTRVLLKDRDTLLLCSSWIDRGLVDHHVPNSKVLPHRPTRREQRRKIRLPRGVDRGRRGDDKDVSPGQLRGIVGHH